MANLLTERSVDIRYGTKAVGLITDENGAVIGVQATDYYGEPVSYYGNHIVLASGGWGNNNEMIVTYWGEDYDGLVYGGSKGMDGTMLNAAVSLGADLVDMNDAHIDATLEVTRGITITTNVLRNCGGILVSALPTNNPAILKSRRRKCTSSAIRITTKSPIRASLNTAKP